MARTYIGKEFHSVGPAILKLHLPAWANAQSGTVSLNLSRRVLDGSYGVMRSHRYAGAVLSKHLKMSTRTLYSTRAATGSQCEARSTGVMCARLGVLVSIRAAAFWTRWILARRLCLTPTRTELQKSTLEVTKAWITISSERRSRQWEILLIALSCP